MPVVAGCGKLRLWIRSGHISNDGGIFPAHDDLGTCEDNDPRLQNGVHEGNPSSCLLHCNPAHASNSYSVKQSDFFQASTAEVDVSCAMALFHLQDLPSACMQC